MIKVITIDRECGSSETDIAVTLAAPGSDALEDQRRAHYRDLLKQADAWIKRRPDYVV